MRRVWIAILLLGLAGTGRASDLRGQVALGWSSIYVTGLDPSFKLFGRLRLEMRDLFGSRGGVKLDFEGRRAGQGVRKDPLGVREFRIDYQLMPDRLAVQLGRVSMAELDGLQIDGATLRYQFRPGLSLQVGGGVRPDWGTPDGQPDTQRPALGLLLRAEGQRVNALFGVAELRSDGKLERRLVTGSAYGKVGEDLSLGVYGGVDLGQAGHAAKLTSLMGNATYRRGRVFDVGASFGLSRALFYDPRPEETALVDVPEELQPLTPDQRFGPQFSSLTLRGQVSPFTALSLYTGARWAKREDEVSGTNALTLGARYKFSKADTSRVRAELTRIQRAGLEDADLQIWRWKAVGSQRLFDGLEVEAGLGQALDEPLEAEATMFWTWRNGLSLSAFYSLDLNTTADVHALAGQITYRFRQGGRH